MPQKTVNRVMVKRILLKLVDVLRLKSKLFTINLMAYAIHLVKHDLFIGRDNLEMVLEKFCKA